MLLKNQQPSMSAKRFWFIWSLALGLWLATLGLSAPWDLPISVSLVDRSAWIARTVATYGEWPAWVVVLACAALLIISHKPDHPWRPLRPLAWAILLLALINPLLITQSLKFLWGRVRFVKLDTAFANFTPFYIPAGVGAGESFPSGHVAMAFVLTPLPFFLARRSGAMASLLGTALVLFYGLLVAYSRILAGAHYLTDCVFAAGLAFLLGACIMRWTFAWSDRAKSP